jgi:hypothetical protein
MKDVKNEQLKSIVGGERTGNNVNQGCPNGGIGADKVNPRDLETEDITNPDNNFRE